MAPHWSWAAVFRARQHLRQSLWAVPLVGAVGGLLLASLDLRLEGRVPLPAGWSYSASTASAVLSAVVAAMVGLIGLVVTIGVLVVQMATGTLSPRFMRLWYRDRLQKFVLASFTATFAFSFVLLSHVASGPVPDLGVTMAGIAVTVDLFLLLVYLDRFVHALRPVAVAAAMARSGLAVVEEMSRDESLEAEAARSDPWARQGTPVQVRAVRSGAIQAIHVDGIRRAGRRAGPGVRPSPDRWRLRHLRSGACGPVRQHGPHRLATNARDDRSRARADDRPGPRLRDPHRRRHRHTRAVARGQRPDHRHPDDQPHRGAC